MSAPGLLSAALAALRAGGSVHVDITSIAHGGSVAFSDDATGSGGRQVITIDGTGHATILLIDGVDYVRADAQALQGFFEVTAAAAEQAAGQWISLRPGEKLGTSTYDDVTAGITLSSVATELQVGSPLSKTAPATVAGQPVIGVQAPLPASDGLRGAKMVLYVTDDAALRPVRYELVGGGSYPEHDLLQPVGREAEPDRAGERHPRLLHHVRLRHGLTSPAGSCAACLVTMHVLLARMC